jgi:hypothetical protein
MSKKAQSDTMKVVVAAAIFIALLLIGLYFGAKIAKSGKEVSGCGAGNDCATDASLCTKPNQVLSLTACQTKDKKDGRCCTDSPV